ncbi:MAG: hypothetical protein NVS3B10_13540 [Polyangiales bacterium]
MKLPTPLRWLTAVPAALRRMREDVEAVVRNDPACRSRVEALVAYPGMHALWIHRVAHDLWTHGHVLPARLVSHGSRFLTGVEIHPGARIGHGVFIDHGMGVVIGETSTIGDGCILYKGVVLGGTSRERTVRHPQLGKNVTVGSNACILGHIEVGEGARIGAVDTIVCHTDFDGLCAAAKWLREGVEPYPGSDADARAIDTRMGTPSPIGERFDRAIRGRPHDEGLFGLVVRHLSSGLSDAGLWAPIDAAATEHAAQEAEARRHAQRFERLRGTPHGVAYVDVTSDFEARRKPYDKTLLLLLGQEREPIAVVVDRDTVSIAAAFDSGIDFLALFKLSGGMPTRVSVPRARLGDVFAALGVDAPV